jgi:hypothetical protein
MKNLIFLLMMGISGFSFSQEFTTYPNGLIYDEGTMNRLGVIVDSLNLKFRSCDLSKPYYSFANFLTGGTWRRFRNKYCGLRTQRLQIATKQTRVIDRNMGCSKLCE